MSEHLSSLIQLLAFPKNNQLAYRVRCAVNLKRRKNETIESHAKYKNNIGNDLKHSPQSPSVKQWNLLAIMRLQSAVFRLGVLILQRLAPHGISLLRMVRHGAKSR